MKLGLKIDFDTERGTREGIPNLLALFKDLSIKATFLFSLGPDRTGRALKRIFRPGFFKKVQRTSVLKVYGLKTLGNGIFWPSPNIGALHQDLLRQVPKEDHEVGIHCYDHIKWQDTLDSMTEPQVRTEIYKSVKVFEKIFGFSPKTMGAAGWQANKHSLAAYDDTNLTYASDTRGIQAFYPSVGHRIFQTLQIPTTLPTLDELLGRPEYPLENLIPYYLEQIQPNSLNILTIHAELEGMYYLSWFKGFLTKILEQGVTILPLRSFAHELLKNRHKIPVLPLTHKNIEGRSGLVATHSS